MPGYISHSIIGSDLHKESSLLFKTYINKDSFKTYNLGIDLASFSLIDFHNKKTKEFLISLIKYIKDNKLKENSEVLSFMYGHISHYFFDLYIHPLVYYIEKGTNKVNLIPSHTIVEGYIDSYLSSKILNKDITNIDKSFLNKSIINKDINKLINEIYYKVFNIKGVYNSYKSVLSLLNILERSINNISKKELEKLFMFDKFLTKNNLTKDVIVNENNDIWLHPITGETSNNSLLDLYNSVYSRICEVFCIINRYLYDNKSIDEIDNIIPNLSYDTGKTLILGKSMKYYRNK